MINYKKLRELPDYNYSIESNVDETGKPVLTVYDFNNNKLYVGKEEVDKIIDSYREAASKNPVFASSNYDDVNNDGYTVCKIVNNEKSFTISSLSISPNVQIDDQLKIVDRITKDAVKKINKNNKLVDIQDKIDAKIDFASHIVIGAAVLSLLAGGYNIVKDVKITEEPKLNNYSIQEEWKQPVDNEMDKINNEREKEQKVMQDHLDQEMTYPFDDFANPDSNVVTGGEYVGNKVKTLTNN